ncbi:MAG: insulinase family protein [Fimbriimonadaceae bacterium]|nr:insulinase family protein [Fimbriimonadaceae bacterium]
MTALLATLVLATGLVQTQGATFIEAPDSSESRITIQALVRLPELHLGDRAAAEVLVGAMRDGSNEYGRVTMRRNSAPGYEPRFILMPDHIRVSVTVDRGELSTGLGMIVSLLRDPLLSDEALNAAIGEADRTPETPWLTALRPELLAVNKVRRVEVVELYQTLFQPSNIFVVAMGEFDPGRAEQEWNTRTKDWQDKRIGRRGYYGPPLSLREKHDQAVTTVELVGPAMKATDADYPSKMLALYALGVGKGSTLHRIVRDREALSYRQEAILWPSPSGFRARFLLETIPTEDDKALPEKLRTLLAEDIKAWTQADVDRALGLANASLNYGIGPNPLYWSENGPLGKDLPDRAFLIGYWRMKAGKDWDPAALVQDMRKVGLEDLKTAGERLVLTALPRVISGK